MRVLVVGSGGREHALVWAASRSRLAKDIFCANGNAGISGLAECVDISPGDIEGLADFAERSGIDLTFVGGESSLAAGIVDLFVEKGLPIIGATKAAARLESSKSFAKEFMSRHSIPTADFGIVRNVDEAESLLASGRFGGESSPVVVKADGLAAGKGVVMAAGRQDAIRAVKALQSGETIDESAAEQLVIEECLVGKEVSLLMFADGRDFALMPPTRDHKRIGEGDTGPNTGGMGTITDPSLLSSEELKVIVERIVRPTLEGAAKEGFQYSGILFLGLMMTSTGAKVLEYNVRFGDPEAQAILVNLESDFLEICGAMIDKKLHKTLISWKEGTSACVILAAEHYPGKPRGGDRIHGLEEASKHENVEIFHSGTAFDPQGNFVTAGGRVLGVTAVASNQSNAIHRAYKAVNEISWDGMQFRRDIGR